ncbi:hypothetical protein [Convivina intestini]|uniref:Uncharacterized protein n=1 Tax=Convivina intestini TaxID=1505726 RepID=A0A2U1D5A6_9LACO|nr:hypothetical protein [Convivina intestini]PVY82858.1 hypothetical protein C7384_11052 [Convivina intestini]CAH1856937.1 hypothetical protein R077811_01374 [Convivina intestini]SDC11757.1 hypothetical protein SAMN05216341_11318 [Leuconostocaceae bacterium R-53105]
MKDEKMLNLNDLNHSFIASYADDLGYISRLLNLYKSHPFAPAGIYYHGFIFRIAVISVIGNFETILGEWSDKAIEKLKKDNQIDEGKIPSKKDDRKKFFEDILKSNNFFIHHYLLLVMYVR